MPSTAQPGDVTSWANLTVAVGRVLVDADSVVVAVVALVTAEQIAGVHLVEARRARRDAGLHEAALGVLALGARDDPVVLGPEDVVAGRELVVVCVRAPERDNIVVGVLPPLPVAALSPSGVPEAQAVATATAVVVPAAGGDAVVLRQRSGGHTAMRGASQLARAIANRGSRLCDVPHAAIRAGPCVDSAVMCCG